MFIHRLLALWCPECAALNAYGNKKSVEGTTTVITLLTNFVRMSERLLTWFFGSMLLRAAAML